MKKFGYRIMALVAVFSMVLLACAAPKSSAPAPTPAPASAPGQPTPTAPQLTREQLVEAAKKEGEVVVWSSTWQVGGDFEKLWKAQYPGITLKVWDSDNGTIIPKALEEAKVMKWSTDVFVLHANWAPDVIRPGLIREYDFGNVAGWEYQTGGKFFVSTGGSPRIPTYNTKLLSAAEAPKTYDELKDRKWRGKAVISLSGETSNVLMLAYLWRTPAGELNWDASRKFWAELADNVLPMTGRGFDPLMERVAAGEFPLFLTASITSAVHLSDRGAPIALAEFKEPIYMAKNALMIAKNAPHPAAAQLLMDFMTANIAAFTQDRGEYAFSPAAAPKVTGNRLAKGIKYFEIPAEIENNVAYAEKARTIWAETVARKR